MGRSPEPWRPLVRSLIFPSSVGAVCTLLRAGFTAASFAGVTTQPDLPDVKVSRMVTVRDDSGPDDGVQSRRRHGVNVWAETSITAESLALLAMAVLRSGANGRPITLVDQMAGPYKVDDDPAYVVGSDTLSHYFFTCRISVRASDF